MEKMEEIIGDFANEYNKILQEENEKEVQKNKNTFIESLPTYSSDEIAKKDSEKLEKEDVYTRREMKLEEFFK